jgi:hypothetical protein
MLDKPSMSSGKPDRVKNLHDAKSDTSGISCTTEFRLGDLKVYRRWKSRRYIMGYK